MPHKIHKMSLVPEAFEMIRSGKKRFEHRLNDEKRRDVSVGDYITFTKRPDLTEELTVEVVSLEHFPNFGAAYDALYSAGSHPSQLSRTQFVDGIREYYTEQEEQTDGALTIGIRLLNMTEAENIRPWGRYDILDTGEGYQVKRIVVQPGQRLSYQRHQRRAERWTIVSGMAKVVLDDAESFVPPGGVVFVEKMMKHRIENPGDVPLLFIEVQLGDYLGEDDIERFSDDYGRN